MKNGWLTLSLMLTASLSVGIQSVRAQNADSRGIQPLTPKRSELDYQAPATATQDRPTLLQPARSGSGTTSDSSRESSGGLPVLPNSSQSPLVPRPNLSPSPAMTPPHESPTPSLPTDATIIQSAGHLNSVAFMSPQDGIAVGNQGLIWRTTDGGRRWSVVRCDCAGDLLSVAFGDQKTGWAVGGRVLPVQGLHEGIVLRTHDGGVTWKRIASTMLPRLTHVAYDPKERKLWATGDADGQYPFRMFESFDLGQNWNDVQVHHESMRLVADRSQPRPVKPFAWQHCRPGFKSQPAVSSGTRWLSSANGQVFRVVEGRATIASVSSSHPTLSTNSVRMEFQAVQPVGREWIAVGSDGEVYLSRNQGSHWEAPVIPSLRESTRESESSGVARFATLATAGDSAWVATTFGNRLLHYDGSRQVWSWQVLPTSLPLHSLCFIDEKLGWAVGPLGTVLGTADGGQTWHWLHRSQPSPAVLLVAAVAEDIPPELLAHLSLNLGLNVAAVVGGSSLPDFVAGQVFSYNDTGLVLCDPRPFDPSQSHKALQSQIQGYLQGLQPQIVFLCPANVQANARQRSVSTGQGPMNRAEDARGGPTHVLPAGAWLEALQSVSQQTDVFHPSMLVTLTNDQAESSTSPSALATQVGRLLGDLAWPSRAVSDAWREPTDFFGPSQKNVPPSLGVRRIAAINATDLGWFSGRGSESKSQRDRPISRRPVRSRTSSSNVDVVIGMTQKPAWLNHASSLDTGSPEQRSQWHGNLASSQAGLPSEVYPIWLFDLANHCESRNDLRKATLARWELLQSHLDQPIGLAVLLETLQWILSDEAQWENRKEEQQARTERFAELQKLFAAEESETLSEAEARARALRRFGIEPEMERQVPTEILERIVALDRVQREAVREGRLVPDPEIERLAAVPQTRIATETDQRQFQTAAGQLNRQTTVLTWDSPAMPEPSSPLGVGSVARGPSSPGSIVDAPWERRLEAADRLIKRADGHWPNLNSLPQWWALKARVKRDLRDSIQTEIAWNRLLQSSSHAAMIPWMAGLGLDTSKIEKEKNVAMAMAELGDRIRLETLADRYHQRPMQTPGLNVSHGSKSNNPQGQNSTVPTFPNVIPVTWTLQRPYLDGSLDEPLWQGIARSETAAIQLANDEQYLYIAIRVPVTSSAGEGTEVVHQIDNRVSNTSRTQRDQVNPLHCLQLLLDTDGDGRHSYRILIDPQGGIADQQGGQTNWNPTLFVAQKQQGGWWQIELAIDTSDLASDRIGQPWAIELWRQANHQSTELITGWLQLRDVLD